MKKILQLLILTLIILCFNGCWGWGWFVPYSFQPSYHKFKKMCKLNELPNDEYKYNQILKYFDTDLDRLDWEELNKKAWKISEDNGNYKKGAFEYAALTKEKEINSRLGIVARPLSNESEMNPYNINQMSIDANWNTRRYVLRAKSMAFLIPAELYWDEIYISCVDIVEDNMMPKGSNSDK